MTEKKHSRHIRVMRYIIPFADELPATGFKPSWVDWAKKQVICFVMRNTDRYAHILEAVSFNFVDANDNIDTDAAEMLSAPYNIQKSYYSVNFDIKVKDKKKARQTLKKPKNTIFLLKARLKAARAAVESMVIAMVGPPGLGAAVSRQVSATGRVTLELEFPRPVIWCDKSKILKDDGRTQKITVDTTKEMGEEFIVNLMEYDTADHIYKPKNPPPTFKVEWEQDEDNQWLEVEPDKVSVTNSNRVKVVAQRLVLGNKINDTDRVEKKKIGRIIITLANPLQNGPKPINEKHAVSVFYKPKESAKAHILIRKKSCFFCGTACSAGLPDPKTELTAYKRAECPACKLNKDTSYFDDVEERTITGEKFDGLYIDKSLNDDMKDMFDVYWRIEFDSPPEKLNAWAKKSGFKTDWKLLN